MDQVIARASVSRATLCSNFADKGALLAAVIAAESERIVMDAWAQDHLDRPIQQTLTGFGRNLLRFIAEPDTMAFERLIAQAALAEPAYGAQFFAAGPGRARSILMALIYAGQARGELGPADPEQAANDLLGLWQGSWKLEIQYGHRQPPKDDELDRLAHHAARQFMRLYARAE